MKNTLSNMIDCLKKTQISKHYDSETKFTCGKCDGQPFAITMKGDFTVNALQILAVCTAVSAMWVTMAIAKKLKK